MRRLVLCSALLIAACSPALGSNGSDPAAAEANRALPAMEPAAARGKRIELVNNARRGALVRLEVAAIDDRGTFREVVAARGLAADAEKTVAVGPGCVYDMRAAMADGARLAQYRVDVCFRARIFLLDWPAEGEPPTMSGQGAPAPEIAAAAPEPEPMNAPPAAAPPAPDDLDRGLPVCPGDPRCKKK